MEHELAHRAPCVWKEVLHLQNDPPKIEARDAAQQAVPVQQDVTPVLRIRALTASDRSLDIRRTPSPVLRRSCRRVYLVAPPLLYLAPAAGRRPRRPVLPHSVPASLPHLPYSLPLQAAAVPAAPGRCRAACRPCRAGPLPGRPGRAASTAAPTCTAAPRPAAPATPVAPLCIATAPAAPVQVAPPHPASLLSVSEWTGPDSPTH